MQNNARKCRNKKEELMSKDKVIDMVFGTNQGSGPKELAHFHGFLMMKIKGWKEVIQYLIRNEGRKSPLYCTSAWLLYKQMFDKT